MHASTLRAEIIKLHRAPIWVAFVALPLVGFLANAYGSGLACPYAPLVMGLDGNGRGAVGPEPLMPFLAATAAYTILALGAATLLLTSQDVRTA